MLPLIPLSPDPKADNYVCQCTARVNLLKDRFHCLGCTAMQKTFNVRHHQVVTTLNNAMIHDRLPFVRPMGSAVSSSPEYTLPRRDDDSSRRADLGFVGRNDVRFIFDVAVMAPTARSYIRYGNTDRAPAGGAHGLVEGQKELRYRSHTHPTTPINYTYTLVPFIIDATGNFGTKAERFFSEQNMEERRRKPAIRAVRALIDWNNAEIRKVYKSSYIPPLGPGGRRLVANVDPFRPKKGRPPGRRDSRPRVSRGSMQQAAAVIQANLPLTNYYESTTAVLAIAPDIEGTNTALDVVEGVEPSTRQT